MRIGAEASKCWNKEVPSSLTSFRNGDAGEHTNFSHLRGFQVGTEGVSQRDDKYQLFNEWYSNIMVSEILGPHCSWWVGNSQALMVLGILLLFRYDLINTGRSWLDDACMKLYDAVIVTKCDDRWHHWVLHCQRTRLIANLPHPRFAFEIKLSGLIACVSDSHISTAFFHSYPSFRHSHMQSVNIPWDSLPNDLRMILFKHLTPESPPTAPWRVRDLVACAGISKSWRQSTL